MGQIKVTKAPIEGLYVIEPTVGKMVRYLRDVLEKELKYVQHMILYLLNIELAVSVLKRKVIFQLKFKRITVI